ncbi:hypothetical protein G6F32_014434 [Rhizopus arrhizus]|nr:hypothetical protein G6F32_014434 [Rhizopus arrhizus]
MRIVRQRHVALRRVRHVGIASHVCDGRGCARQEVALRKLAIHDGQQGMRARQGSVHVKRRTEHGHQAGRRRATGQGACGHRQPALHLRRPRRALGQPGAAAVALGQVDEDGVGIRDHHAVVVDHRHLAERVHCQEFRTLLFRLAQVHVDAVMRHLQQGQHQRDAMRVAGQGEAVEGQRSGSHAKFSTAARHSCSP